MKIKLLLILCLSFYNLLPAQCFTYVSTGRDFTLAVKEDGTLWAWGGNQLYQLGDGTLTAKTSPIQIGTDTDWQMVTCGYWHSLAIKTDGTLWAWGSNTYNQLGDGTTDHITVPTQIGTDTNWEFVAAGFWHSMALKTDGSLWAFGSNSQGVLGNGLTIPNYYVPTQVGTDMDWETISTSRDHILAVKTNGTLWSWGTGYLGALGTGSPDNAYVPVQVGTDTDWDTVSANDNESYGIKTNGTLWAWGHNDWGQLGNGTQDTSFVPVQVGTGNDWRMINSCDNGAMAIKLDGTLWSWGNNFAGQLALGPPTGNVLIPTQVGSNTNWEFVGHATAVHFMAISSDGKLWGSGRNLNGALGDGTTTDRSSPTEIFCTPLSVAEFSLNSTKVQVYPNPSQSFFTVNFTTVNQHKFDYELVDILGKTIRVGNAMTNEKIDVENLQSGSYFLKINVDGVHHISKILKQ